MRRAAAGTWFTGSDSARMNFELPRGPELVKSPTATKDDRQHEDDGRKQEADQFLQKHEQWQRENEQRVRQHDQWQRDNEERQREQQREAAARAERYQLKMAEKAEQERRQAEAARAREVQQREAERAQRERAARAVLEEKLRRRRKRALTLFLVGLALGLLTIPAYFTGTREVTSGTARQWTEPGSNLRVWERESSVPGVRQFDYSYDSATVLERYSANCGSALHPNSPPVLTVTERETTPIRFDSSTSSESPIIASSLDEATSRANALSIPSNYDPPVTADQFAHGCESDLRGLRLEAIFTSPPGLIAIGAILLFAVGLGASGGGITIGSITPNIWGGGFTLRFWK
jgi:hypothetical protein